MDIFQEVKSQVSTRQAYEHYSGQLKKKASRYWGLCPWHKEKTPSFVVFEDSGFKCYGCGQAGPDSIAFVAKLYHLSMIDAVKKIIEDFSLPIDFNGYSSYARPSPDEVTYPDFMAGLNEWKNKTFDNLCRLYRITKMSLSVLNTDDEIFSDLVLLLADLDNWTDILIYGDMLDVFILYKKLKQKDWG